MSYYTTINDPAAGPGSTILSGINDVGQIVGSYGQHGFLYSGGTFTPIDDPAGVVTGPSKLNDSGQIVGTYYDAGNVAHGFLYSGGIWTTLDDPAAAPGTTTPTGINDSGQIVGMYADSAGHQHGFIYSGGLGAPSIIRSLVRSAGM